LGLGPQRIDRPNVEAAQLESIAQYVSKVWHQARVSDDLLKDFSFIDEVGQATATGLLFEFRAGPIAFFGKDPLDSTSQRREQFDEKIWQSDEPDHIELLLFVSRRCTVHRTGFCARIL
jgi:hypothetical protein